jgi:hypothetical protein
MPLLDELPAFQFAVYDEAADRVVAEAHTGPLAWIGADVSTGHEQPFQAQAVDATGIVVVDTPEAVSEPGGRREALYQDPDAIWVWLTEFPPAETPESTLHPFQAWLPSPWWGTVLAILAATTRRRRARGVAREKDRSFALSQGLADPHGKLAKRRTVKERR